MVGDGPAIRHEPIGLVGCGRMGRGIVRNLVRNGWSVLAWDVSESARHDAARLGAQPAGSSAALVEATRTIVTCLPDLATISAIYEGVPGDPGLLARCQAGALLIETSSSRPAWSIDLGGRAAAGGIAFVDAPLVGTADDAWAGTLTVLAGGAVADVERAHPVLTGFAANVLAVGPLGHAHTLKALNNTVAMANHAVVCEVFAVAEEMGLDLAQVLNVLRRGYGASRKLEDVAPKLIARDHPKRAVMATVAKDLDTFRQLSGDVPVATPLLDATVATYRAICDRGNGREPPSRLAELLRMDSKGLMRRIETLRGELLHGHENER